MAYEIKLTEVEQKLRKACVIASGSYVKRGELIGYSSGWKRADSSAATYIYAQYIALETLLGDGVQAIDVCKAATFTDDDAPYTADTPQYLGDDGALTETRPATDGDLVQVVGRSLTTSKVRVEVKAPVEWELFLTPDTFDTTGEPGLGTADAGWPGPQIDLAGETVYFKGRFPSGIVGSIAVARVVYNSIGASALDMDVTVVGGYDGASNVQDTGAAITAGDWNEDADNKLLYQNIAAAMDADFYKPARNFAVLLDPDGITGDAQVVGLYLRGWRVP